MIVLDTNVVSELLRVRPDDVVLRWVDRQDSLDLALTAVTTAELRAGVRLLPDGRRRQALSERVESVVVTAFAGRILPFDDAASTEYGAVLASRRDAGRPIATLDALIAAVCRSRGAVLATRNVRDFDGTGVDVVDPWSAPA